MFARTKKAGQYAYLQIVQDRRDLGAKTIQRVVATIGRMDQPQAKGEIENRCAPIPAFPRRCFWSFPARATSVLMPRRSDRH